MIAPNSAAARVFHTALFCFRFFSSLGPVGVEADVHTARTRKNEKFKVRVWCLQRISRAKSEVGVDMVPDSRQVGLEIDAKRFQLVKLMLTIVK